MVNLSAFIRFHARLTPDRPAILYDGQVITYAELAGVSPVVSSNGPLMTRPPSQ